MEKTPKFRGLTGNITPSELVGLEGESGKRRKEVAKERIMIIEYQEKKRDRNEQVERRDGVSDVDLARGQ